MSQVVLYPCIATWISEAVPGGNYGTSNRMNIGAGGKTEGAMRTLLRIDLQLIGAATIADTSKLELYDTGGGTDAGNMSYYAYNILQTGWTEEGATWTTYDGVNSWDGAGCSTIGTDYEITFQPFSFSLGAAGWQEWTGATFQSLLQEAIDNHGGVLDILMKWDLENADNYSHYEAEKAGAASRQPKLTIDYADGDVPGIASIAGGYHQATPGLSAYWTCVKTIAGEPVAHIKSLAGVSQH